MRSERIRQGKKSFVPFQDKCCIHSERILLFFHHTPFVSVIDIQGESLLSFTVLDPVFTLGGLIWMILLWIFCIQNKCYIHSERIFHDHTHDSNSCLSLIFKGKGFLCFLSSFLSSRVEFRHFSTRIQSFCITKIFCNHTERICYFFIPLTIYFWY